MTGTPYRSDLFLMFILCTLNWFLFVHPDIHPREVPWTTFWPRFPLSLSHLISSVENEQSLTRLWELQVPAEEQTSAQRQSRMTSVERCHDTWQRFCCVIWWCMRKVTFVRLRFEMNGTCRGIGNDVCPGQNCSCLSRLLDANAWNRSWNPETDMWVDG